MPPGKVVTAAAPTARTPVRIMPRDIGKRIILNGVEGIGKTSTAAHAPAPLIVMVDNETGYETLFNRGLVPAADVLHERSYAELLDDLLTVDMTPYKTLVVDAAKGVERLMFGYETERRYDGDPAKFVAFQNGPDTSQNEWANFTDALDRWACAGKDVILLSHIKIGVHKNPDGSNYSRYQADVHEKSWAIIAKWADAVLFYNYLVSVDEKNRKAKGDPLRVLHAQRGATYDAKNRYGMDPSYFDVPNDPALVWGWLMEKMNANV